MERVETVNDVDVTPDPWSVVMPSVPRIVRAVPKGPITRPPQGIPVIATIRWHHGVEQDLPATAEAWTSEAVQITWEEPNLGLQSDWIPARDVRRSGAAANPADVPPHTRAGRPRARW
jgi:hypothetical protein